MFFQYFETSRVFGSLNRRKGRKTGSFGNLWAANLIFRRQTNTHLKMARVFVRLSGLYLISWSILAQQAKRAGEDRYNGFPVSLN